MGKLPQRVGEYISKCIWDRTFLNSRLTYAREPNRRQEGMFAKIFLHIQHRPAFSDSRFPLFFFYLKKGYKSNKNLQLKNKYSYNIN